MKIPETGTYDDFKAAVLALPFTLAEECVRDERGLVTAQGIVLEWCPVRMGTVRGVVGRYVVYDDMDGNIVFRINDRSRGGVWHKAKLNHITGAFSGLPPCTSGRDYKFTYFFDSTWYSQRNYPLILNVNSTGYHYPF